MSEKQSKILPDTFIDRPNTGPDEIRAYKGLSAAGEETGCTKTNPGFPPRAFRATCASGRLQHEQIVQH
jgi:hypothetical protein